MAVLRVVLPEGLEGARVSVQIHVVGALFDAIVGDAEVRVLKDPGAESSFRVADVTLACGHEASVFGREVRVFDAVEVVVVDAGV